ncbi:hypothetical protein [Marinicella sp. W31]|uniref:hypothetical protein n=1 Tax=Marinicella sp. W31 TaxID=3023713 RepID=UPI0037573D9F
MKSKTRTILLVVGMTISQVSLTQSLQNRLELARGTVDNGGGLSQNSNFQLTGTIGQHDATQGSSEGGTFVVAGGFWANAQPLDVTDDLIFANGFEPL